MQVEEIDQEEPINFLEFIGQNPDGFFQPKEEDDGFAEEEHVPNLREYYRKLMQHQRATFQPQPVDMTLQ